MSLCAKPEAGISPGSGRTHINKMARAEVIVTTGPPTHLYQATASMMSGTASSTVSITLVSYSAHCV